MQRLRLCMLSLAALPMLGSLAWTGGYAAYLHSDGYRLRCAAALSRTLDLPSTIGAVVPLSLHSRGFRDVEVWLPQRRSRALMCRWAVLRYTPVAGDPEAYELDLTDGLAEVSTATWLHSDYRQVLQAGLRPGFTPDGPRRVHLTRMDLRVDLAGVRARFDSAGGQVDFLTADHGRARLVCPRFNGHELQEPAYLSVEFSPRPQGIRLDSVELRLPRLPLHALDISGPLAGRLHSGSFGGSMHYQEDDAHRRILISGLCCDLLLSELLGTPSGEPPRGWCPQIELTELRIQDDRPVRLRFRGTIEGLDLGALLPAAWGLSGVSGHVSLDVEEASITPDGIEKLLASGRVDALSLLDLSRAVGRGLVSGTLRARIDDLTIRDNRLESLRLRVEVDDAGADGNWIETRLVQDLLRRTLNLELPPVLARRLPERLEFSRLGMRVEVQDEQLHVYGTHGEGQRTILTVRVMGQDVPLIEEPTAALDLAPLLDRLRSEWLAYLTTRLGGAGAQTPAPAHP